MNRRTSVYLVEFPRASSRDLDDFLTRLNEERFLEGSGVNSHGAFVRVRVSSDETAAVLAARMAAGRAYIVSTGYGINRRAVHLDAEGTWRTALG